MLCQHCKKNPATITYTEVINGKKFESRLCAQCYADLSISLNSQIHGDIWAGLFGEGTTAAKTCPVCGLTYDEYERTGLLGCTSCYDVFKEELIPSIRRIQGKVTHVGKKTDNNDEFGLHRQLKVLQEELEEALRQRRYSDANVLNRRIQEIYKRLYGG